MPLAPTFHFTIESVYDDTPLDCRIYHPTRWPSDEHDLKPRGAIIAHPYTVLGGSYDDGIVLLAVAELVKAGFVAGTFNFRGAGSSQGQPSWTGKAELLDYISFIGLFVHYLDALRPSHSLGNHSTSSTVSSGHTSPSSCVAPHPPGITLILGGYSYGSLLTSRLPALAILLDRFAHAPDGTPEARIKSHAVDLALKRNQSGVDRDLDDWGSLRGRNMTVPSQAGAFPLSGLSSPGGEVLRNTSERPSIETRRSFDFIRQSLDRPRRRLGLRKSTGALQGQPSTAPSGAASSDHQHIIISRICYLLISPLVPPVSLFLTMFSKPDDQQHPPHPAGGTAPQTPSSTTLPRDNLSPPERNLVNYPTLAIYGTRDFFGSRRKLRDWAENLACQPQSLFQYREIIDAGHFWQEPGADQELRCRIRECLRDLVGLQHDISPHRPIYGHTSADMR